MDSFYSFYIHNGAFPPQKHILTAFLLPCKFSILSFCFSHFPVLNIHYNLILAQPAQNRQVFRLGVRSDFRPGFSSADGAEYPFFCHGYILLFQTRRHFPQAKPSIYFNQFMSSIFSVYFTDIKAYIYCMFNVCLLNKWRSRSVFFKAINNFVRRSISLFIHYFPIFPDFLYCTAVWCGSCTKLFNNFHALKCGFIFALCIQ